MSTAEMNGVSALQVAQLERRDRYGFGLQFIQGRLQSEEIRRISQQYNVRIATELSSAVQDAGLSAHQECANVLHR